MTGKELAPLPDAVRDLPEPREFGRVLRERLEAEIVRVRAERGDVHDPEDVFQLTRGLARYIELAGEYQRAFAGTVKIAKQELESELADAVGEQDGVPMSGMTVPDLDGTDVVLSLDAPNTHFIDLDALLPVVAVWPMNDRAVVDAVVQMAASVALGQENEDALVEHLAVMINMALVKLLTLGSFTAQVTKVRAFQKELSADGFDNIAAIVRSTMRTTTEFKGVKVARKERK